MAEGTPAVYKEIILKTIREKPWKDGKGFGLWVVQKFKDGKSHEVSVRAGMYRPDKVTGEMVLPKDGLNAADFKMLREIFKTQIEPLLDIPKGTPYEEPVADTPIEEVPW